MARNVIQNSNSYVVHKDSNGNVVKHTRSSRNSISRNFSKGRLNITQTRSKYNQYGDLRGEQSSTFSINLFGIILVILLACSAMAILGSTDGEPKTFYSFLQMMQDVPSWDVSWLTELVQYSISLPDWLSFLNTVIDFLTGLASAGIFLLTGILQALTFIVYILGWILA